MPGEGCKHLQVTVPAAARRANRLRGEPVYGWCRACRTPVDAAHIRKLRPASGGGIYWVGENDEASNREWEAIVAEARRLALPTQLALF